MKGKEFQIGKEEKKTRLSPHERDQLRTWIKTTPLQRLNWLEEAMQLAAKTKVVK
jgi:hypothetical protein